MKGGGEGEAAAPRSPLAVPIYRALWLAVTVSFLGSFLQDVAERWVILELTGSPLPAAMLGTAFVTASLVGLIPAGILADRRDRRSLVVASQLLQATAAGAIALLSATASLSPQVLLAGSAAVGLGMALGSPAWSAMITEILPRELVAEAIALQAVAFNIARAIGPALGGLVIARFGATACFALNAASFVVVTLVLVTRRSTAPPRRETPAPVARAFAESLSFATHDTGVRASMLAMVAFTSGGSLVYGLAPAYGKQALGATATQYGIMFGAMGLGAVLGARVIALVRTKVQPRTLVTATTLLFALSALAMSRVRTVTAASLLFLPAGAGWTGTFSSTSTLVQLWTPDRLRARTVALYTVAQFAMWAAGSSAGGLIAERWDVRTAMLVGSVACMLAGLVTSALPLPGSFVGPPDQAPAVASARSPSVRA